MKEHMSSIRLWMELYSKPIPDAPEVEYDEDPKEKTILETLKERKDGGKKK